MGFAGAFRRSELCAINCSDLEQTSSGLIITLSRSKTDQEGIGRRIGIPYARGIVCPVRALQAWLGASKIDQGPIFRSVTRHGALSDTALSSEAISSVVKARAKAAGLDATVYSGHSLRAGLATSAAQAGIPTWQIRKQTGHASDEMLARYIRDGELFIGNPLNGLL
jgi:integrase